MPFDRPISELLKEPCREWSPNPPADDDKIAELIRRASFELPEEYVEFLQYCGELDAPPLLFNMNSIAESVEHNQMWRAKGEYVGFWFIGGNGGLETIGFDLRGGSPWPLVMIDCIAGNDSAERIAANMSEFIEKIGPAADRSRA